MSKNELTVIAYEKAGFRERYAMNNYATKEIKKVNNHKLWIFRYGTADPYQDANGATFDTKLLRWIN